MAAQYFGEDLFRINFPDFADFDELSDVILRTKFPIDRKEVRKFIDLFEIIRSQRIGVMNVLSSDFMAMGLILRNMDRNPLVPENIFQHYTSIVYNDAIIRLIIPDIINTYPLILIQDPFAPGPHFLRPQIMADDRKAALEKLIEEDVDLKCLFTREEGMDPQRFITSLGGNGISQISNFFPCMVAYAERRMLVTSIRDIGAFIEYCEEFLKIIRMTVRKEKVSVEETIIYSGIALPNDAIIILKNGIATAIDPSLKRHLPREFDFVVTDNRPNASRIIRDLSYRITFLEEGDSSSFDRSYFQDWENVVLEWPAICAVSIDRDDVVSARWSGTIRNDPLMSYGTPHNIYKRFLPTVFVEDSELDKIQKYAKIISELTDNRIWISLKRLVLSATERTAPEDSFIDSMIGLEALFCGENLKATISSASAKMLSCDPLEIENIRKEISRLYDLRSDIVHGRSTNEETISKWSRSTRIYLKRVLQKILERPELINKKSTERANIIMSE